MATVTHIGVLFSAKLVAILMAFVGLLAGVLYAGIGAIYDATRGSLNVGTVLAFMAIVGMPAVFAASGFVAGAIGAFLYNVFARWFGGIALEMDFTQ